jgi:hypothetical protein
LSRPSAKAPATIRCRTARTVASESPTARAIFLFDSSGKASISSIAWRRAIWELSGRFLASAPTRRVGWLVGPAFRRLATVWGDNPQTFAIARSDNSGLVARIWLAARTRSGRLRGLPWVVLARTARKISLARVSVEQLGADRSLAAQLSGTYPVTAVYDAERLGMDDDRRKLLVHLREHVCVVEIIGHEARGLPEAEGRDLEDHLVIRRWHCCGLPPAFL